jgi:hypothetical protein
LALHPVRAEVTKGAPAKAVVAAFASSRALLQTCRGELPLYRGAEALNRLLQFPGHARVHEPDIDQRFAMASAS